MPKRRTATRLPQSSKPPHLDRPHLFRAAAAAGEKKNCRGVSCHMISFDANKWATTMFFSGFPIGRVEIGWSQQLPELVWNRCSQKNMKMVAISY